MRKDRTSEVLALALVLAVMGRPAEGQARTTEPAADEPSRRTAVDTAAWDAASDTATAWRGDYEYRGIRVGMSYDDAKRRLGLTRRPLCKQNRARGYRSCAWTSLSLPGDEARFDEIFLAVDDSTGVVVLAKFNRELTSELAGHDWVRLLEERWGGESEPAHFERMPFQRNPFWVSRIRDRQWNAGRAWARVTMIPRVPRAERGDRPDAPMWGHGPRFEVLLGDATASARSNERYQRFLEAEDARSRQEEEENFRQRTRRVEP